MKRREFLQAMSATALATGYTIDPLSAASVDCEQDSRPETKSQRPISWEPPFDSPPILQNPAHDGVTVFACVNALCTAWVEYGETETLGSVSRGSMHGLRTLSDRVHRIRIDGLRPGTRYFYRVMLAPIDFQGPYKIARGAAVASGVHQFTTLDEGRGSRIAFNVINDTHEKPDTLRGVTSLIAQHQGDFTFWNGDIFDDVRSDQQIVDQMMRPRSLTEPAAAFAAETPLCFVSGNHDVRGIHARHLDRFLDVPASRRYHLIRQGPAAILVLDTGEDKPDDHPVYAGLGEFAAYRDIQRRWLERAVVDPLFTSARIRIVMQHIPMFGDAASEDSLAKWHPILNRAGIDLMICGHVHTYAWHEPNTEHNYAQLVGGGPAFESATFIRVEAEREAISVHVADAAGKTIESHAVAAKRT